MAEYEILDAETPSGAAYSEICYFDKEGNMTDETEAYRCIIREYAADGTFLNEIYGMCNG